MISTILMAGLFLGLLFLQVLLWAVFLRLGLWWARADNVTTRRIALVTGTVLALQVVLSILFRLNTPSSGALAICLGVLELVSSTLIPCLVIAWGFKVRFLRAVQAWLPTLFLSVAMVLFALLVLQPFVCEAFVTPANSMAPTLLGKHWQSTCPDCGESSFCSPVDPVYRSGVPLLSICRNFHVLEVSDVPPRVFPGDRFLVTKFLAPKRWDIIVFEYPEDPSTLYVKRLVGLPGETVQIEDGAVWINGNKLDPPDELRGIEYLSEMPEVRNSSYDLWGTKDRPAVLGKDEYFVLGDFSARSKDSRLWQQGVPGHNPFAVPASHFRGVVSHIYWPPERWRILR